MLCKTRYPIVLLHGTGSRDWENKSCWGRIPKALTDRGAEVYFGNQDAWGTIEKNALIIKANIDRIIYESDCEKVNIIAISKGGIEARYIITKMGMKDKIASLTTVSTPHHGSKALEFLCLKLKPVMKIIALFINKLFKILGDKEPDFYNMCLQLTTINMQIFNQDVPDVKDVYYQSYAGLMKKLYSDMLVFFSYLFVRIFDGEGDGIVSVNSAKWGNFKGIITGKGIRGMSHCDLRDLRKRNINGTDIREIYINIVNELKEMGF